MNTQKLLSSRTSILIAIALVVIIIAALIFFIGPRSATGEIIARVGNEVITQHDVEVRIQQSLVRGKNGGLVTAEPLLFDRSLDDLISESLLFQDALKQGFSVDEEEIERRFQVARDSYDTEEEFLERMEANFVTPEEFRTNIGRQDVLFAYLEELKRLEIQAQVEQAVLPGNGDGVTIEVTAERIPVTGEEITRLSEKRVEELKGEIDIEVYIK